MQNFVQSKKSLLISQVYILISLKDIAKAVENRTKLEGSDG